MNYAAQSFVNKTASNGRLSYNDQGQMTASGVIDFLNNGVANIANKNRVARKSLIANSLARLKALQTTSLTNEDKVYKKLDCDSLAQLQEKIDTVNMSGLQNLSAEVLNQMPLIRQTRAITSVPELEKAIRAQIRKTITEQGEEGAQLINNILDNIVAKEFEGDADATFMKRGKITGASKRISLRFSDKAFADSGRKARILAAFNLEMDEGGHLEGDISRITVDDNLVYEDGTMDNWSLTLDSYPYFPWATKSEERKQILLNIDEGEGQSIWLKFKQIISNCAPPLSAEISHQMDRMGVAAFATAADSGAGIKGVLGELYTLVLFASLGLKDTIDYVGDQMVEGKKIGIDAVLEGIGVQVKNYAPYRGSSHGINLRSTLKLGTFLERLVEVNERDKEAIGLFYATTAYHLVATPLYQSIFDRYSGIENRLKNLYATQIDQFMPLHEISWIDNETNETVTAQNAFYVVGAGEIVPVSLILGIYIKFLEELQCGLENPRTFAVNLAGYDGQTYLDYWKATTSEPQQPYEFQTYDNIVGNLSVNLNINLNIDYTIQQVLSRVAKS